MADFNIPDGPDDETYEQEVTRVGDHIPDNLKKLWLGLLGGPEDREQGWPEMVATFLQLDPAGVIKCLASLAMIHLVRLGGSMLKIENTGDVGNKLVVCFARDEGAPFLADGYRIGKMNAVLSSQQLAGDPLMLPYVERMHTLLEQAAAAVELMQATAKPEDFGTFDPPEFGVKMRDESKKRHDLAATLEKAVAAVRELLTKREVEVDNFRRPRPSPPSNEDVFGRPGNG